jgi:LysR family transcriptional regulator, glycine cleavage system transcriptional activator
MSSLSRVKAIQAFEATARNGSFVAAAAELCVTPAAVGQQVRALEQWLGVPLFRRLDYGAKRLIVNDDAQSALTDFREGFARLDVGVRKLRERRVRNVVTVTASQAFVAKWLLPRLEGFTSMHPHIDIRLDVTDGLVDLARGEADIGLRCGPGQWQGLQATKLMDEEVFPVCSPALHRAQKGLNKLSQLSKQTLIHDATLKIEGVFPTWRQWLQGAEANAENADKGLRINSSAAVIQAAINAQGVALARCALVNEDLRSGLLMRLFPQVHWPIKWAYYIVHTQDAITKPHVKAFHEWLLQLSRA